MVYCLQFLLFTQTILFQYNLLILIVLTCFAYRTNYLKTSLNFMNIIISNNINHKYSFSKENNVLIFSHWTCPIYEQV